MKATLKSSALLLIVSAITLNSCVKNDAFSYLNLGSGSMLNTTISTLVLQQANANNTAGSFTWTAADFGYKAAITYSLQFTKAGTNFAQATTTEVNIGSALTKTFTVGDFNAKLLDILPYGVTNQIEARIKADVGSGVAPIYSNVVKNITVTPYRDIINYGFPQALYIAGNYQGWDPGSSPKIVDKFASGTTGANYEGYINFTDGSPHEFKMVKGNNWGAGDFGAGGSAGTLSSPSGTNLSIGAQPAGVYLIRANTSNLTWSATRITTWGIIGSAVPGTGWNSSVPMTFNAAAGTWTITTNLLAGEIKFRANDDWAINFGDNGPADNKPDYGGSNIAVGTDGN